MLELILEKGIIFYTIGVVSFIGIFSKAVVYFSLKRLVAAASMMNKSTHPLMKLVRAKFEHACMLSDRVQNVRAFVDKHLYEYRVLGIRLHTWRQMEKSVIWETALLGAAGAALEFSGGAMNEQVFRYGAAGAVAAVLLFVLHNITDEEYQLEAAKVYMVDFLENVYAHKYEKSYQRKPASHVQARTIEAVKEPVTEPGTKETEVDEPQKNEPIITDPVTERGENPQPQPIPQILNAEAEPTVPREAVIREILEEFLA